MARLVMGWGLLLPKGWAGLFAVSSVLYGLLEAVQFTNTITVGSIMVASLVIVAGGVFTFRNNMRTFWRNLAEERAEQIRVLEERAREMDAHLVQMQEQYHRQLEAAADEQRMLRHDLKNQLAATQQMLAVEHSKTDLSSLIELLAQQHVDAMARMEEGLDRQARMLRLIEASMPPDAVPPDLKSDMGAS